MFNGNYRFDLSGTSQEYRRFIIEILYSLGYTWSNPANSSVSVQIDEVEPIANYIHIWDHRKWITHSPNNYEKSGDYRFELVDLDELELYYYSVK